MPLKIDIGAKAPKISIGAKAPKIKIGTKAPRIKINPPPIQPIKIEFTKPKVVPMPPIKLPRRVRKNRTA